jgi:hypothetical protein
MSLGDPITSIAVLWGKLLSTIPCPKEMENIMRERTLWNLTMKGGTHLSIRLMMPGGVRE